MFGRQSVRLALSLALALSLSGCLISAQDGNGNIYTILEDGTIDMSGADADTLNTIKLKSFFPWTPGATNDTLVWCRAGGGFTRIMLFEDAFNYWVSEVDFARQPGAFLPALTSACDATYNPSDGTYSYDLAVSFGAAFTAVITGTNTNCILFYIGANESLLYAADICLQADTRESTYDWGLRTSPGKANILRLVVDESIVGTS